MILMTRGRGGLKWSKSDEVILEYLNISLKTEWISKMFVSTPNNMPLTMGASEKTMERENYVPRNYLNGQKF